jgi:hypothetical protein
VIAMRWRYFPMANPVEQVSAFPSAAVDSFLSHFIIAIKFLAGDRAGQLVSFSLPVAVQTVARSQPFVYQGPTAHPAVRLAVPLGSSLAATISDADFFGKPEGFFEQGKEHVWLQILDLEAKAETSIGSIRIILGETFKKEYPDIFEHSLGAAQSIGATGFPARLFFSPNAVIETPFGALKTRAGKALVGATITEFPPIGSNPSLSAAVPLDSVNALRAAGLPRVAGSAAHLASAAPVAQIQALSHAIDAALKT